VDWLRSLDQRCGLVAKSVTTISAQAKRCVIEAYRARASEYRTKLKGDALIESNLSPEEHVEIQQALAMLGYFTGEMDGEFGPITRKGISTFLTASGAPENDFLSSELRQKLLRDARGVVATRRDNARQEAPAFRQPAPNPNAAIIANQIARAFGRIFPGSAGEIFRIPNQQTGASIPSVFEVPNPARIPAGAYEMTNSPDARGNVPPSIFPTAPSDRADAPLLRYPGAPQIDGTRTLEVTALAESPEAAR
jgi:peptidoglycan hydrolase-like protein with peptidoglycan-binding domain